MRELRTFLEQISTYFDANGGHPEFKAKFEASPYDAFYSLFSANRVEAQTFFRLIDDQAFIESLLSSDIVSEHRENLSLLWSGWKTLRKWDVRRSERLKGAFCFNPYLRMMDTHNYQRNDIYQATGMISAETVVDEIYFKCIAVLDRPDKNFGNQNELFIDSSLSSFILSINVLLNTLIFTDVERARVRAVMSDAKRDDILRALTTVGNSVEAAKAQFS